MTLRCPRLARLVLSALAALPAACAGAPEPAPSREPASAAPAPAAPAEVAPAQQTRAVISREPAEDGRSLRVLVEDLRPGERVALIALEGPDGRRLVAGPADIRTGSRSAGSGLSRPRVQLQGGNNDPLGVTLSLDVFSTRPEGPEPRESALAWAFLPLPDPAAYAAAPGAWTVHVLLEDEVGRRLQLSDQRGRLGG